MKFCSECGSDQLSFVIPQGDNRPRHVCSRCGMIHYLNPKIVAGCLVQHEGQVLLCRRAIEPRYGLWTMPAGFMENQETTEQAAIRETWEEARATVCNLQLYNVISIPYISQVYITFLAQLVVAEPLFAAGSESLEVALFDEAAIPWEQLAFPVVQRTLKQYYQDRQQGLFSAHVGDIIKTLPPSETPHINKDST